MPALKPTSFSARVIWLGTVTNEDRKELMAEGSDALDLTFAGLPGSVHGGATRASCSRVVAQYPKGTEIRNERQLSIVSAEDLARIASEMGVETLDPARLGASIVIEGIPDFSLAPPSARLQGPSGVTVTIDMQNRPCHLPARSLEAVFPGKGKLFKEAAKGLRGVTASVARPGRLSVGDTLTLHIPDQPVWPHLDAARAG